MVLARHQLHNLRAQEKERVRKEKEEKARREREEAERKQREEAERREREKRERENADRVAREKAEQHRREEERRAREEREERERQELQRRAQAALVQQASAPPLEVQPSPDLTPEEIARLSSRTLAVVESNMEQEEHDLVAEEERIQREMRSLTRHQAQLALERLRHIQERLTLKRRAKAGEPLPPGVDAAALLQASMPPMPAPSAPPPSVPHTPLATRAIERPGLSRQRSATSVDSPPKEADRPARTRDRSRTSFTAEEYRFMLEAVASAPPMDDTEAAPASPSLESTTSASPSNPYPSYSSASAPKPPMTSSSPDAAPKPLERVNGKPRGKTENTPAPKPSGYGHRVKWFLGSAMKKSYELFQIAPSPPVARASSPIPDKPTGKKHHKKKAHAHEPTREH